MLATEAAPSTARDTALPPVVVPPVGSLSRAAAPSSPNPSEVSANEQFFSPAESFHSAMGSDGTPRHGTPSLTGLLEADERADQGVPALSSLLEQDENEADADAADEASDDGEATMEMTMALGGILPKASALHAAHPAPSSASLTNAALASMAAAVAR